MECNTEMQEEVNHRESHRQFIPATQRPAATDKTMTETLVAVVKLKLQAVDSEKGSELSL